MKYFIRILFFALLLQAFAGCHLERIDALNVECPNPPVANFTVSTTSISLSESIVITNLSDPDAATYDWDFGNGETSKDFNASTSVTYNTAGTHEIILIVTDAEGCSATTRKTITVANELKFKTVLNLGSFGGIPLGAVERSDGQFHCLYNQSGIIKSVVMNPMNIDVTPSPVTIPVDINPNIASAHEGGFIVAGSKGNLAKVAVIGANQQKTNIEKEFQFTGASSSSAWGPVMNSTDEVICTGYRNNSNQFIPGLARISSSNSVTSPSVNNSNLNNYGGLSVVEQAGAAGNYYIAATKLNPYGGSASLLVSVSQSGIYGSHSSLAPITVAYKIMHLSGSTYVVIGSDNNSGKQYLIVVKPGGNQTWSLNMMTAVSDVCISNSDPSKVVVLGTAGNALGMAQINLSTGVADWDEFYSLADGSITGISIAPTSDGGYLTGGHYNHGGKNDFYLIKTNSTGKAE
ncbi:MAG: PKD domain-containing protein [Lewinellaceae bacterium]|nr:PKD domain-containing protein [Saprospiraceae bacterium]MCB9354277.1 PKD domain-containing protein [Lewinellaceae bacterium]